MAQVFLFYFVLVVLRFSSISSHRFGSTNFRCNSILAQAIVHKTIQNKPTNNSIIESNELNQVLAKSLEILSLSVEEIKQQGWKLVYDQIIQGSEQFSLYKRRPNGFKEGPYEYLMIGIFKNVSPKNFLLCQTQKALRELWDDTLGQMNVLSIETNDSRFPDMDNQDSIYYRVKWPWPLKDRDYTLIRRSKVLPESNAIAFTSRAVEISSCPHVKDVMRVDNYRCESAFISTASNHATSSPRSEEEVADYNRIKSALQSVPHFVEHAPPVVQKVFSEVSGKIAEIKHAIHSVTHHGHKVPTASSVYDKPGVKFVSVFCDDQKVPLPSMIVDALSKQAERMAAQSIVKLHKISKERTDSFCGRK